MRPLSIHHVINELTVGGAETLLSVLAAEHQLRGHNVAAHALAGVGSAATRLVAQGISVFQHARAHPISTLLSLLRAFRRQRPHIVHCHNIGPALLAVPAARLAHVPAIVITRHGGDVGPPLVERKFWLIARLAHRVVAVSRLAAEKLARAPWASARKLTVILNGAAGFHSFPHETSPPPPPGTLRLVSVARLDPIKDFPTLLRAIAIIAPSLPGLRLTIVGDGVERARLEELVKCLSLEPHVRLLGEQMDVGQWLVGSDIFVLPSLSEGIPIALLEAMSVGLPAVVTEVGGLREVVECCGSGILVPPKDPARLATAILRLARDPEQRHALGRSAHLCQRRHFSATRVAEDYLRLYDQCLSEVIDRWSA